MVVRYLRAFLQEGGHDLACSFVLGDVGDDGVSDPASGVVVGMSSKGLEERELGWFALVVDGLAGASGRAGAHHFEQD